MMHFERRDLIQLTEERYAVRSMTFFGFVSLNGKDVVVASQQAKAIDMVSFLEVVRGANGREAYTRGDRQRDDSQVEDHADDGRRPLHLPRVPPALFTGPAAHRVRVEGPEEGAGGEAGL